MMQFATCCVASARCAWIPEWRFSKYLNKVSKFRGGIVRDNARASQHACTGVSTWCGHEGMPRLRKMPGATSRDKL
jgi:hypothetical protein